MLKITLSGIDGEPKNKNSLDFPSNKLGLSNQSRLKPTKDMPFFGLKKGQEFCIFYDGVHVCAGGLTWSVSQLIEEIENGYWEIC